jgi:hypothetical protein
MKKAAASDSSCEELSKESCKGWSAADDRHTVENGQATLRCHLRAEVEDSLPASCDVQPVLSRYGFVQQLGQTLVEVLCTAQHTDKVSASAQVE